MSNAIKKQLQEIIDQEPHAIKAVVAKELIEQEDPKQFSNDLYHYGCISGMVGSMIYYHDTYAFFDKHYHEILEIRGEMISEGVFDEKGFTDLKNEWAWIAYEYVAREIAYTIGLVS